MNDTVAITGASGFIGRAICQRLYADGWRVRALVRSPARARLLADCTHETVAGDIHDSAALEQLCRNSRAVVHCAGVVRGARAEDFDRVNVEGVRNLVAALSAQAAPPRLLSLSSLAAREPGLSFYAASKYKGEQVLQQASGLDWIALRPPAVYGPGDRELLPLFRLMGRGIAPVPGVKGARFSMLFVEDMARLVEAWLGADTVPNGVYTLHDGRQGGYSWEEVIAVVEQLCQRRVRALPVPPVVFALPAWINRSLARWLGYAPMLTPEKLRELRHPDWVCDNEAIGRVLDWRPRVQLEGGLRGTPGWCPGLDQ